jgi:cation diffusion facilitator CzcD-associated flavoprotein CzcO
MRGSLYLHHTEMLAYLEKFTDHFGLREHIRFRSAVRNARLADDGSWEVRVGDGVPARFRVVVVATGYDSVPLYPGLPGRFHGIQLHTHEYRTAEPFHDLDTVVIGLGCSATELACEIRREARSVTIAARSANWALPRRLGALPIDWFDTRVGSYLPWSQRRRILKLIIRLAGGGEVNAGAMPHVRLGDKPVAVTDELMPAIRAGEIRVTGPVVELTGDSLRLADGSQISASAILYGTGYQTEFPFLPPEIESPVYDAARLYRGIVHPKVPGLFFVGLVSAHGALIPMFEAQAKWIAAVLAGELVLPANKVMRASIARDYDVRRRNFDPRIGFLWDRLAYIRALEAEARRAHRRPGISPRAATATVR